MTFSKCLGMAAPVLFLSLIIMSSLSTGLFPKTRKNLNESAALSCDMPCQGVALWKKDDKEVARCGSGATTHFKFSCEVKEGKQVLLIPWVNYSTRGLYSVYCGEKEMFQCRHFLQLLAPESACELDVGSYLRLDLQIYGPVQVWFTSGSGSPVQLCSVSGRDADCSPEYAKRVLVIGNILHLMNLVLSDSGNYTVREEDGTLVSVLNMTVKGGRSLNIPSPEQKQDPTDLFVRGVHSEHGAHDVQQSHTWTDEFGAVTVLFGFAMLVLGVFLGLFVVPWCRYQFGRLYKRCRGSSCGQGDEAGENAVPLKVDAQINMEPEG